MKEIYKKLVDELVNEVCNDLRSQDDKTFELILAVYNHWQEEMRDGVDYIFDTNKADDAICCLKGGMKLKELFELSRKTKYFFFGVNHENPSPITNQYIVELLVGELPKLIPYVLTYANQNEAYKTFYEIYLGDKFMRMW